LGHRLKRIQIGDASFGIEDGFAHAIGVFSTIYISLESNMIRTITLPQNQQAAELEYFRYRCRGRWPIARARRTFMTWSALSMARP
jgi:hypothetical protein